MPITVFGSINQDLVAYTNKIPNAGETIKGNSLSHNLGGKGLNQSIAISKLKAPNDKFSIKLWGCLGDPSIADNVPINEKVLNYLKLNNINTNLIQFAKDELTGTAVILVDETSAENRILYVPGANNHLKPDLAQIDDFFNQSNHMDLNSSIEHPNIPSNLHSHVSKPLNNEQMAKTTDINPHPPSNLHSHSSSASLLSQGQENTNGLVYKDGNLIHSWSASGTSLNMMNSNQNPVALNSHIQPSEFNRSRASSVGLSRAGSINRSRASSVRASEYKPVLSSTVNQSIGDHSNYPSEFHSHSSHSKLQTLTYPSPKPSSLDLMNHATTLASKAPVVNSSTNLINLNNQSRMSNSNLAAQQRLTNISFSLGGTSAHSSSVSLTPAQSYINMLNPMNQFQNNLKISDDLDYYIVLTNEIPEPCKLINYISKKFPNVVIFYNCSPLPINKSDYNTELLNALHNSNYIILNEHELKSLVMNFHSNPLSKPLSSLRDTSNFDINEEYKDIVGANINLLTKLRSILTKPNIIVTLGEYGVLSSNSGEFNFSYVPSEDIDPDDIVDTTAAGDTFLGGLITSLYRKDTLENSIKFGVRAASVTIQNKGAAESMPAFKTVQNRGWLLE